MEVCVDNIESLVNAVDGGASRIELCSALSEGGLTPSTGFLKHAKSITRAGDFCYGENDIRIMSEDAKLLVEAGADGIVFGCLDPEANIDVKNCQTILESVKPRSNINFTFHRAFDLAQNPMKSAEVIKNLGFSRILTSGQEKTAQMGIPLLRKLVNEFQDNTLIILPGGGVNENNLEQILKKCSMGSDTSDYSLQITSVEKVEKMVKIFHENVV